MNKTVAELLAERKKLDAKIKRAVAKAFPVGSRWHLSGTYLRSRVGTVVVVSHRDCTLMVKWENETDNYDARLPVWGPSSVGMAFSVEPRHMSAIASASPGDS